MKVQIYQKEDTFPNTNWVLGEVMYNNVRYTFSAKAFEESSVFGINNGCVSKLWVTNENTGKNIFAYDRGYDRGSTYSMTKKEPIKTIMSKVVQYVKNYGKIPFKTIRISKYNSGKSTYSLVLIREDGTVAAPEAPFMGYRELKGLVYDTVGVELPSEKELKYKPIDGGKVVELDVSLL